MPDRQPTPHSAVDDDDLLQFLDDHEHAEVEEHPRASPGGC